MADVRNVRQERQVKAFQQRGEELRQRATQSPLGESKPAVRRSAPAAAPKPAAPAAQPSSFGKGATGLSASPGGLNVSPEELQKIQQAFDQPAAAPKTIYIPGVGSVTVGQ